ncbi:hypothetical protein NDU88_002257 [Pleurodeles waltl]|uniref:Uncharacterized protein n=1 Tax=Pleurodeles waltl TaxID=8319 RepID=A0AAV7T1F4_PLEWA|nr:hypothetical protein NDU88_002257 [Pleurodeles waltl]
MEVPYHLLFLARLRVIYVDKTHFFYNPTVALTWLIEERPLAPSDHDFCRGTEAEGMDHTSVCPNPQRKRPQSQSGGPSPGLSRGTVDDTEQNAAKGKLPEEPSLDHVEASNDTDLSWIWVP